MITLPLAPLALGAAIMLAVVVLAEIAHARTRRKDGEKQCPKK